MKISKVVVSGLGVTRVDQLAVLAKEYAEKRDYAGAIAIVDSVAKRDAIRADVIYRYAFRVSFPKLVKRFVFNFVDYHSRIWFVLESSKRGKKLLKWLEK
nr:hypothetical protein [uncultured Sphaerochaeta sp.]